MIQVTLYPIKSFGGDYKTSLSYKFYLANTLTEQLKGLIIYDYIKETGVVERVQITKDPIEIMMYADMLFNHTTTKAQCNHTFITEMYKRPQYYNFVNQLTI